MEGREINQYHIPRFEGIKAKSDQQLEQLENQKDKSDYYFKGEDELDILESRLFIIDKLKEKYKATGAKDFDSLSIEEMIEKQSEMDINWFERALQGANHFQIIKLKNHDNYDVETTLRLIDYQFDKQKLEESLENRIDKIKYRRIRNLNPSIRLTNEMLDLEVNPNLIVKSMSDYEWCGDKEITKRLLDAEVNPYELFKKMYYDDEEVEPVREGIDIFINHPNVDPEELRNRMFYFEKILYAKELKEAGATYDLEYCKEFYGENTVQIIAEALEEKNN